MDKTILTSFPYHQDAKKHFFPVIPIRFHFDTKTIDSTALIDSGATISVFRADVALNLGLVLENGEEIYLGGVGGHIKGYIHKIKIEVSGKTFLCPIVFSREYLVSFNLLGREAFFEHFKIIFDEKKRFLSLE